MDDNESILVELRKISAWADLQRKMTKWSLMIVAVFIPVMIAVPIVGKHWVTKTITDTTEKPDWYLVDQNARQGDFDKAIRIGEKLMLKTGQNPDAHRRLAWVYLEAGKVVKAREHYAEAVRLLPCEEYEKMLVAIDKRIASEHRKPESNP